MTAPVNDGEWPKAGVEMTGVREYAEKYPVKLVRDSDNGRLVIQAVNEGGHNVTHVDLHDVLDWCSAHRAMLSAAPPRSEKNVREAAVAALAWFDRAMDGDAGCDYLNGDLDSDETGWTDAEKIASSLRTALSAMPAPAAPDETEALRAEVKMLRNEVKYFREREQHFVKVLGIPDGGRYRNDWDAYLKGVLTRNKALEEALLDATAHLVGAASAYRKYACRHRSVGRGQADPFFTTRVGDFARAADRAQKAVALLANNGGADE